MTRCTSSWGYAHCALAQGHYGTCEGQGYRWYRGRGHARKKLVESPDDAISKSAPQPVSCKCDDCRRSIRYQVEHGGILPAEGERPVFGVHRLPARDRRCAAWPTSAQIEARREAAYQRTLRRVSDVSA